MSEIDLGEKCSDCGRKYRLEEHTRNCQQRIIELEAELAHSQRIASGAVQFSQKLEHEIEEVSRLLWITPHDDAPLLEMVSALKARAKQAERELAEARKAADIDDLPDADLAGTIEAIGFQRDDARRERDEERARLAIMQRVCDAAKHEQDSWTGRVFFEQERLRDALRELAAIDAARKAQP